MVRSVEPLIFTVRDKRVIAASDLARVYGVETRALNQAVKRNAARFPADFAFRLTFRETVPVGRSRSQSVILKRGTNAKYRPLVFTEHGAIMAATVLNSPRAVQMSVFVVRAFLRLREWALQQKGLALRLGRLERRVRRHDDELGDVILAIRSLVKAPPATQRRIGFEAPRQDVPPRNGQTTSRHRRSLVRRTLDDRG